MTFIQYQKFLSTYKKHYYSCHRTIPYFQFSIQKSYTVNNFKHGILKTSKTNFSFGYFLSLNCLRIRNILVPFGVINQIYLSSYFIRGFKCSLKTAIIFPPPQQARFVKQSAQPCLKKNTQMLGRKVITSVCFFNAKKTNASAFPKKAEAYLWRTTPKKSYQIIQNTQLKSFQAGPFFFFYKKALAFQAQKRHFSFLYKNRIFGHPCLYVSKHMPYDLKADYKCNMTIQYLIRSQVITNKNINFLAKRQRFIRNSLKGILLVNFPEKEKNFLIKNLAAENKIALITQSASLLLKDSRNMDDLLSVDDPIQILFDRVKTCIPCICFINNLDRIGKQRYEQKHKSVHELNRSFSLLVNKDPIHDRVFKTINKKERFNIATTTLSSQAYDFQKMTHLQNFKTFQRPGLGTESVYSYIQPASLFNWRESTSFYKDAFYPSVYLWLVKKAHPCLSIDKQVWLSSLRNIFFRKHHTKKQKNYLRFLNTVKMDFKNGKIRFRPETYFAHRVASETQHDAARAAAFLKTKATFNQKFNTSYYHRLPVWLCENDFFPKHKISTGKIQPFYFVHKSKNKQKSRLAYSQLGQLKANSLLLQMLFSQAGFTKMFSKTQYNTVSRRGLDSKNIFKNSNTIDNRPLFKNSLIKSDSIKMFNNNFKPVSKLNKRYSLAKKSDSLPYNEISVFSKNFEKRPRLETDVSVLKEILVNNKYQELTTSKYSGFKKLTRFSWPEDQQERLLSSWPSQQVGRAQNTIREHNKSNSLEITETEIIKRTALLKFLQILDGFHTVTGKKKSIRFPYLNIFALRTQTNDMSKFKFKHGYSELFKPFRMSVGPPFTNKWGSPKMVFGPSNSFDSRITLLKNIKLKSYKFKTYNKYALSRKNFLVPLISRPGLLEKKSEKHSNAIIINSIQNNQQFSKTTVSKNRFFGNFLQKTVQSFSFVPKVPKWEPYLKNQPALKQLNLLCVWPSYIEDVFGSFNLNDGGSYILPEYFQLLGHGPKLKKQGITLIASTNNLTTLDAALLRPGRFDTIINFSYSSLFSYKSSKILKHSPSLNSILSNEWNEKTNLQQGHQFSKSSIKESGIYDFSIWPFNPFQNLITKEKNFLFKKNTDFLFNNVIWTFPFSLKNSRSKVIKNQFPTALVSTPQRSIGIKNTKENIQAKSEYQVMILDIPNQSLPIKTFIDVSVFIQYKLWWSFNNGKLSWFRSYQNHLVFKHPYFLFSKIQPHFSFLFRNEEGLLQEPKTQKQNRPRLETSVSDFENFKTFKFFNTNVLNVQIYKIKRLIYLFFGVLRIICFKFFYNAFQFFMMFKMKFAQIEIFHTNKKFIDEARINQNSDSFNALAREVLISKVVSCGLPKNSYSLDFWLERDSVSKKEVWTLNNSRNQTIESFKSDFHVKGDTMFLKYNRRLLFCTGDFDYNTYSKKHHDFILVKTKPWQEKQQFFFSSDQRLFPNMFGNKSVHRVLCDKTRCDPTCRFSPLINVTTAFLSSKIWKDNGIATVVKNVNTNNAMLTKYNEIYKLKQIKLKQDFFNLHPFSRFMLKRWPEIKKSNKLKQHLKIPLYQTNQQNFSGIQGSWLLNFDLGSLYTQIYHNLYSAALLIPNSVSFSEKKWLKTVSRRGLATNNFFSRRWPGAYEPYLFRKLSTNSSLNITCLQINSTLIDYLWFNSLNQKPVRVLDIPKRRDLKKTISISGLDNQTNDGEISFVQKNSLANKNGISNIHLAQTRNKHSLFIQSSGDKQHDCVFQNKKYGCLNKIPRQTRINYIYDNFQRLHRETRYKRFNVKKHESAINNNIILLKNFVFNEKKEHNFVKTRESFFENYRICRLDISFFLLTFYTMFFEEIQHKKIILNTIKIFMPYRSLIFSHFLLSKSETYGFSCKNFEILIYNKFKNFLVDF